MSKQTKIILVVLLIFILLIIGLFIGFRYFVEDNGTRGSGVGTDSNGGPIFPNTEGSFGSGGSDVIENTDDAPTPTLREISSSPTAGAVAFQRDEDGGQEVVIRYINRETGHIFETTRDSLRQTRVSNTTIPRIQHSTWKPDGSEVILHYLDGNEVLKSFYGAITDGTLEGVFLSNNILETSVHTDSDLVYVRGNGSGGDVILSNFDGTDTSLLFSSMLSDWRVSWGGDKVFLTTSAANNVPGVLYEVRSGRLEKIIEGDGLITEVSPNGEHVLFSTSDERGTSLFVYDIDEESVVELPFRTLAEKCAWSNSREVYCASPFDVNRSFLYPDDWYKGIAHFSDDIWKYDVDSGIEQLVYDMNADNLNLDITNLSFDEEGSVLLFKDNITLSLWSLKI